MEVFRRILEAAIDKGVETKEMPKHDLNLLVDTRPHQGLALGVAPLGLVLIHCLEPPPRGRERAQARACMGSSRRSDRSSEFLGYVVLGVIFRSIWSCGMCARDSAPLSGVVGKASAGALEVMEILSYRNVFQFLERCMESGWQTVGASSAQAEVVPARDLPHCVPTILVLGSEGRGLRTNVKRACNKMVCIPSVFGSVVAQERLSEGDFNEVHDGSDYEDDGNLQGRQFYSS